MTREFYPVISVACLQLHQYTIPFLPVQSRLLQAYGSKSLSGIDVKEGKEQTWSSCVRALEGHTRDCYCIAFSPDRGQLASGSRDCTIWIWNLQTGAVLQVMTGHSDAVQSVTYSPDGKLIASGSDDNSVRVWDVVTGMQVGLYTGHSKAVLCVTFSADGRSIASGGHDSKVHIWPTDTADMSGNVYEADGTVVWLGFLSRNRLAVASEDKSITIWELGSSTIVEK